MRPTKDKWGLCPDILKSESHSVTSSSLQPHRLYIPWNSPGQNAGVGSLSLLQGIFPTQGLNPGLPTLWADSLPTEPQGKPKNTGVGSQSLLQGIFLTQESNWGLLPYKQVVYQLSYLRSYILKREVKEEIHGPKEFQDLAKWDSKG